MPNTLVHIGVQSVVNRALIPTIDLKWVLLGCIIPDLPWILRRAVTTLLPGVDPYAMIAYATVQSSLLFACILAFGLALLAQRPRVVGLILAGNALFHLLLDTVEIKLGGGVNLFAPFAWELTTLALVWPDSLVVAALTLFGVLVGAILVFRKSPASTDVAVEAPRHPVVFALLCGLYLLGPLALMDGPFQADAHSLAVLSDSEGRVGQRVFLERQRYERGQDGDVVVTYAGERLKVVGEKRATAPQVSAIAEFVGTDAIELHEVHEYRWPWRDWASYLGLGLIGIVWVNVLLRTRRYRHLDSKRAAANKNGSDPRRSQSGAPDR